MQFDDEVVRLTADAFGRKKITAQLGEHLIRVLEWAILAGRLKSTASPDGKWLLSLP